LNTSSVVPRSASAKTTTPFWRWQFSAAAADCAAHSGRLGPPPGIKIHDTRIIRLLEVLLHAGTHVGGWTAREIHEAVLSTFHLSAETYGLNQLRYDLRKLKGHGLFERDGTRYAYLLTPKGVKIALLFLFFHKRLCGPLANICFHRRPNPQYRPDSRLEAAYHRADEAIEKVVHLLAAA
jgi:hypothetical protein